MGLQLRLWQYDNGDNDDPVGLTPVTKAELADIAEAQGLEVQQEARDLRVFTPRELLLRAPFGPQKPREAADHHRRNT